MRMLIPTISPAPQRQPKRPLSPAALKRLLSISLLLYLEGKLRLHDVLDLATSMRQETMLASDQAFNDALAKLTYIANQRTNGMQDIMNNGAITKVCASILLQLRK